MPKVTVATVNAALKKAGHPERLFHGRGYFYFYDGQADYWETSSVYVFRADELTVEQWLEERQRFIDNFYGKKT